MYDSIQCLEVIRMAPPFQQLQQESGVGIHNVNVMIQVMAQGISNPFWDGLETDTILSIQSSTWNDILRSKATFAILHGIEIGPIRLFLTAEQHCLQQMRNAVILPIIIRVFQSLTPGIRFFLVNAFQMTIVCINFPQTVQVNSFPECLVGQASMKRYRTYPMAMYRSDATLTLRNVSLLGARSVSPYSPSFVIFMDICVLLNDFRFGAVSTHC